MDKGRNSFHNNALDLWKFIFSILIMLYHTVYIFGEGNFLIFRGGYIGVEFFFIVSGFLMAQSAANACRRANGECVCLGRETTSFLLRKVRIIYPYFIVAVVFSIASRVVIEKMSLYALARNLLYSVGEILLLHQTGFDFYSWIGGSWYLSAMLIGMLFIYPLLRYKRDLYTNIIAPIAIILLFGYFMDKWGMIHKMSEWYKGFRFSVLRAMGDMNIGVIVYAGANKIREIPFTDLARRILAMLALAGYAFVLISCFGRGDGTMDFIWILILAVCVAVTGSGADSLAGWLNRFDSKLFRRFATFSMALYVNHLSCYPIVVRYFPAYSDWEKIGIFCALSVLLAMLCIAVVNCMQLFWSKYGRKIKRYFVVEL